MASLLPLRSLSTSLPSTFRLRPGTPASLSRARSFFARGLPRDDEDPAPSVDSALAKTRLEVLQGWEVNFAVLCLSLASAIALVYVVVKLNAVQQAWQSTHQIPTLSAPENWFRVALETASVVLPIFFVANLVVYGRVTDEQIWTSVLLTVGLLATNPLTRDVLAVPHQVAGGVDQFLREWLDISIQEPPLSDATRASLIWNDAVYTAVIYLYLILAAHSYRVFDVRDIHSLAFYMPKLAMAFVYFFVKVVAGFKADVSLGLIPYTRVLTWLFLMRSGRGSLRITVPVLLMTALDTLFGFWFVREVAVTSDFLATVPYVENRSKQLGFRCFVYQTLAFCFNMIGLSFLITNMIPRSFLFQAFDDPRGHLFQLEPPVARLALAFVYFTWTLVLAYVNLPPRPVLPFVQEIVYRCLFLVRNSRVAVWLGLADIVTAEDAEDSSDDDDTDIPSILEGRRFVDGHHHRPILQAKPTIPFRYRHRELFDDVVLSPEQVDASAPLQLAEPFPRLGISSERLLSYADVVSEQEDYGSSRDDFGVAFREAEKHEASDEQTLQAPTPVRLHVSAASNLASQTLPIDIAGRPRHRVHLPSSPQLSFGPHASTSRIFTPPIGSLSTLAGLRKLRMRKNLFVMETQIMMANAAYLSYIPGNEKEERRKPDPRTPNASRSSSMLHTGSLATNLDELGRRIADGNRALSVRCSPSPPPLSVELKPQPYHDDGTMFLVDPYQIAERYGYQLYRHFSDEDLNTHAIVLINSSRVIVAFSGTRDVTNWGVNANISRVVLDDKLSRFEYEMPCGSESSEDSCSEDSFDPFEVQLQGALLRPGPRSSQREQRMRRSRSEERLAIHERTGEDGQTAPLGASAQIRSYGAITPGKQVSETYGDNERECGPSFVTPEGVTMVAKTFARELMTFGKPKVHKGFIDAYMSLRKQIMGALVELYRGRSRHDVESPQESNEELVGPASTLPLFFCGHSLGGALATFASYEAARYYKRIGIRRRHDISCTTFGCPRIGNEAFKARYERLVETHWRFEIASDPVPKIPLVLLNYVHVGVQVLIDQSGMLLIDPSFIEVQWWGQLTNLYHGYRHHIRASYCMALRAYCKLYRNGGDDLAERFWAFPIRFQTQGLFHHVHR